MTFYLDPTMENYYLKRTFDIRIVLKKLYPEQYNDNIHDKMVDELVRSEIACETFEKDIQNCLDGPNTAKYLSIERQNLKNLRDQLQVSIRGIRGDKYTHEIKDLHIFDLIEIGSKFKKKDKVEVIDLSKAVVENP